MDAPVLAPAGWNCAASMGADGTYGIAVFSPGTPNTLNSSGPAHGDVQTVISAGSPVCSGCSDDIACSVFSYAALHNPSTAPCPLNSPASESVAYLQGSANTRVGMARIYDPANVAGSLPQSGGTNPATGINSYAAGITSAGVLSCVLPSSASDLCTEVVNEYLQRKL